MGKYKINITIDATDEKQAKDIANGFQSAIEKVDGNTLSKMLLKLSKNPQWISMAKKFV